MNILMIAAENGALPGGKVGGLGDVLRDVAVALTARGHRVDVVTPGYQAFSRLPGATRVTAVETAFRGHYETVDLFALPSPAPGPAMWVLEHPGFAPAGAGRIYCDDPPGQPFATDASKFALFCAAAAEAVSRSLFTDEAGAAVEYDVFHLHDWHAALFAVLAKYDTRHGALGQKRLVYTIHNLALQGIRPLDGDASSLAAWFPVLVVDREGIIDPRYPDCFNPTRAAINLCDRVHAVSPTYTGEIQRPSDPEHGFVGGEGLEADLQLAAREQRLVGILNGCEYSAEPIARPAFGALMDEARLALARWIGAQPLLHSVDYLAAERIRAWQAEDVPALLVTSLGRITAQKVSLLQQPLADGRSALEHVLDTLGPDGKLLVLGSGDSELEGFLTRVAAIAPNLLFLRGYSEALAQAVYAGGDLFLMPSSFEPCGISQMLAMRAGQPCLVHGVGGLLDTVSDNQNGFVFGGATPLLQAEALVARLQEAMEIRNNRPKQWQAVADAAAAARFRWATVAEQYEVRLYR